MGSRVVVGVGLERSDDLDDFWGVVFACGVRDGGGGCGALHCSRAAIALGVAWRGGRHRWGRRPDMT